jgi:transcriptional regulator
MYLPKQFDHRDPAVTCRLLREHPLATLISLDEAGAPFVSHLPIKLDQTDAEGRPTVLLGHLARANPQVQHLALRPEVSLSFMGPHAFMSTHVYPDAQRVPTWNYLSVLVKARVRVLQGEEAKDAMLKQLIADHDPPYATQWRGLPETYTHGMLAAIAAYAFEVTEIQTKVKLNQHRPESHAAMWTAYAQGTPRERELAQWMHDLGLSGQGA